MFTKKKKNFQALLLKPNTYYKEKMKLTVNVQYWYIKMLRDGPFDIQGGGAGIFPRDKLFFSLFLHNKLFISKVNCNQFFIFEKITH